MKKIGFIDYFLDEWHAEKYPAMIEAATNGQMQVTYAYGKIDKPGGLSNNEWCAKKGIELLSSIEEVVEKSDYLIVLSPDHPEFHEELSELPLRSGKPTYIDKTFAPDRKTAQLLFGWASEHGTPMYSSSALRFAAEYEAVSREGIDTIFSFGPGKFENYSIHQIEPIVALMGSDVTRIMYTGTARFPSLLIGFADGRQATVNHFGNPTSFGTTINYASGEAKSLKIESDFFGSFIRNLVRFFETGEGGVDPAQTVAIITIIEYGLKAALSPHQWIEMPRS
ncbi:hypothetical protein [Paenibacillus ginsengarvi]|uniref:Gfo/Idh/MocA-like oxidoreductase N-terminal domain-containing protein n=1 Tax=Paenibacillus ginsengarvi TaxID=400777 RepID=A0A3B0CIW3_9BACL|nr:hypothetical protein [Paenibacillus ginsengarvi]RKN84249.1 hypothetical protein D7M11_14705 [Paenibacillus ginsengarvi]